MTTWNYRIVRHRDGDLALHEVYYAKDGKPSSRTDRPCSFACDAEEGVGGIVASLKRALKDATERPVLNDPWPEPAA